MKNEKRKKMGKGGFLQARLISFGVCLIYLIVNIFFFTHGSIIYEPVI